MVSRQYRFLYISIYAFTTINTEILNMYLLIARVQPIMFTTNTNYHPTV